MILPLFAILFAKCQGKFVNPFTDISWKCLFPITIGGHNVNDEDKYPDYEDYSGNPICVCPGIPPHIGIKVSFWEPLRLIDVTRTPYCLVGLGGIQISNSIIEKQLMVH